MHCSTLILVFRRSTQELSSKSFFFALKAVYSGAIKAISFKTLGAVTAGIGALEAAAITVYARALKAAAAAAVTVYARALKAATAAIARVTYLCLRLLQPSGVLMVPNLQFLH